MTVTDDQRFRLHESLNRTLGEEVATTLMQYLPPTGWSELATRTDVERAVDLSEKALRLHIDATAHRLDAAVHALDTKIDRCFGTLDTKIDATAHRLDAKIDGIAYDLNAKIDRVDASLGARIDALAADIARRPTFLQMLMLNIALVGLVLAAVRLG